MSQAWPGHQGDLGRKEGTGFPHRSVPHDVLQPASSHNPGRLRNHPHCVDEETEAPRGQVICSGYLQGQQKI